MKFFLPLLQLSQFNPFSLHFSTFFLLPSSFKPVPSFSFLTLLRVSYRWPQPDHPTKSFYVSVDVLPFVILSTFHFSAIYLRTRSLIIQEKETKRGPNSSISPTSRFFNAANNFSWLETFYAFTRLLFWDLCSML